MYDYIDLQYVAAPLLHLADQRESRVAVFRISVGKRKQLSSIVFTMRLCTSVTAVSPEPYIRRMAHLVSEELTIN